MPLLYSAAVTRVVVLEAVPLVSPFSDFPSPENARWWKFKTKTAGVPPHPRLNGASMLRARQLEWHADDPPLPYFSRAEQRCRIHGMTTQPVMLANVADRPVHRHRIGLDALDWVYGSTRFPDGRLAWGLPVGGISLWAGAAGAGKSRLAVALAAGMSLLGRNVLYCQNEVTLSQLRGWFHGQPHDAQRIHVLDSPSPEDHIRAMEQRPLLVIIDSISMVSDIERQTRARRIIAAYRHAANAVGAHIILVGHLNARGQVKGGTTLPHLVDTTANLTPGEWPGWVCFTIAGKHRFGEAGRSVTFVHEAGGVTPMFAGDDAFPMMQIRFAASDGQAIRRVPVPGTGGCEQDIDESGLPIRREQSWLQRLLIGGRRH